MLSCEEALDEHVGQGNKYVSIVLNPALYAAMILVHTAVSTEPVDLNPREIINELPAECKHEAVEEDKAWLMSIPISFVDKLGGGGLPGTQHAISEGPVQYPDIVPQEGYVVPEQALICSHIPLPKGVEQEFFVQH